MNTNTQDPDASVVNEKTVILPEPLNPDEHSAALPEVGETVKFLETVSKTKTFGVLQLAPSPCPLARVVIRHSITGMTNFTGLIGLRIRVRSYKIKPRLKEFRVRTAELFKITQKYSMIAVILPAKIYGLNDVETNNIVS